MTTERERFEAWAKTTHPRWRFDKSRSDDGYMYAPAATAWRAWQAAVSRAQPAAQALPSITEQQSKWGRLYTAANALVVKMGFIGSMQADSVEMESLKDKLHDLDGGEWMPGLMPPAQPAAPADAAPSVAPEPVAWEELAWSLFTHIRHGDDGHKAWLHRELRTWFALNYPPRAPLTDAEIAAIVLRTVYEGDASTPHRDAWAAEIGVPFARAIEAAHGIGGK